MGVRGNGLGLSWDKTTKMSQCSEDPDYWYSEIKFKSSPRGYSCQVIA